MDRESLAGLAQRAQAGDVAAQRALLIELYSVVRKQAFFLLDSRASAEDVVQDTMLAIHRGLPSFRGESDLRTWAITIAIRTAYRQRRRDRRMVATEELPATAVFDVDQQAAAELVLLQKALTHLAPKKRDAFVLMGLFDLSAKDAARALGTFANTAASRYRHARAELEALLHEESGRASSRGRDGAALAPEFDEISEVGATHSKDHQP
ncbi:MAG TPA: RNA polymerase sigma factor [Kofleriaceae bacterium]|nr:RNA polymerase sigma factor [Kofleriaceae bacterium]